MDFLVDFFSLLDLCRILSWPILLKSLVPNNIIDGGVVGISILIGKLLVTTCFIPVLYYLTCLCLSSRSPYCKICVRNIASISFAISGLDAPFFVGYFQFIFRWSSQNCRRWSFTWFWNWSHYLCGGCLDGTEILGLLLNKAKGFSVGHVVLVINRLFYLKGLILQDWHSAIQSLITFFIVTKIMDMVIVGLDEMKSVMIFSTKPKKIAMKLCMSCLGLCFSRSWGDLGELDVLFLMAERLQLAEIKALVHRLDPAAFIAIENLHEVAANSLKNISNKKPTPRVKRQKSN